jgi:hypothetical protein
MSLIPKVLLKSSEFGISASNATNSSDRSPLIGGSSSPIPRARTDYRAELSFSALSVSDGVCMANY